MGSSNGARIYLIPTLDPKLCAVFLDPRSSLSAIDASNPAESTDKLPGFKKYVQSCFATASQVEEDVQDKDLWVPNFRVSVISDDTLKHTFSGDTKSTEALPAGVIVS